MVTKGLITLYLEIYQYYYFKDDEVFICFLHYFKQKVVEVIKNVKIPKIQILFPRKREPEKSQISRDLTLV